MIAVGMRSRARLAVALVLVCADLLPSGMRSAEPAVYTLHIASQPLDGALQEFARQTGVQVIFLSYLTDGQRAPALDGKYTVDVAIKVLLAGSMLTFRWINAGTIEIRPLRQRTGHAIDGDVFAMLNNHTIHAVFRRRSSWPM